MILAISIDNLDFKSWLITIVGMAVVFMALTLLVIVFTNVPKIGNYLKRYKVFSGSHGHGAHGSVSPVSSDSKKIHTSRDIPAGDSAVIAAALYLFLNEIHDEENRVVTIKRVSRTYSPWNSKIYGVNWMNNR